MAIAISVLALAACSDPVDRGGTSAQAERAFAESDFYWDATTTPHKDLIIAGVTAVARDNRECREIDPSSAYVSGSRGTPENPVFYVTCGSGASTHNVFFSKADVEAGSTMAAPSHIERGRAIQLCREEAMAAASRPETVDFSMLMDLAHTDYPNGNTRVESTFTAENAVGVEMKHSISCLLNKNGLIERVIQ